MDESRDVIIDSVGGKGKGIVSCKNFNKGQVILPLSFTRLLTRGQESDYSVQFGENSFMESDISALDNYFNHSCNPNMKIDFETMSYVALKDISAGEELTWNYMTTEYDQGEELYFDCLCGSKNCYGVIKGFRYLNGEQKGEIRELLSPYLRRKLNSEVHLLFLFLGGFLFY